MKKDLIVIETGHLSKTAVSGGDLLIQKMAPYLTNLYSLNIILPKMALVHWKEKKGKKFDSIPSMPFENHPVALIFFLTYLWRILFASFTLLVKKSTPFLLYSSTNVFVDVIPAFVTKKLKKDVTWIARVHHLIADPKERAGNIIVNYISFFLEAVSLECIKRANIIISLNAPLKRRLINKGFPENKLEVVPGGIDIKGISRISPRVKSKTYEGIFVGRIHATKGIFDIPQIWKNVVKKIKDAKLVIVGETSDKKTLGLLKDNIEKLDLAGNIVIKGFVPYKLLVTLLKKSKVFLFTDHEAGFGLACAEAMAVGLPIVGWDINLLKSLYKGGFVEAPLGNYKSFSQKIITLLTNKKLLSRFSKEAKDQSINLDWSKVSHKLLTILQEI